jgi:hypothetical protein
MTASLEQIETQKKAFARGTTNLFMLFAPLEGWRHVKVTDGHTTIWPLFSTGRARRHALPLTKVSGIANPLKCCR